MKNIYTLKKSGMFSKLNLLVNNYTDLYIKCDVLLLCDIFEKFRETSLHYYKLDPAYYVTASIYWH